MTTATTIDERVRAMTYDEAVRYYMTEHNRSEASARKMAAITHGTGHRDIVQTRPEQADQPKRRATKGSGSPDGLPLAAKHR
jgi:hypothetical protein